MLSFHTRKQNYDTVCFSPCREVVSNRQSMLTVITGERWKNVLSPAFTTGKLKDVMFIMNSTVDTFLTKCKAAAESGETVDIYK